MTTPTSPTVLEAARAWVASGHSVTACRTDGTKAASGPWKEQQSTIPTDEMLRNWFDHPDPLALAVVCGSVSGNLELLELEGRAAGELPNIKALADDSGLGELLQRLIAGYFEMSPSGGWHFLYRVTGPVPGNTKIARNTSGEVLAETRGQGGYVIVAPTPGTAHPSGQPWKLITGGPATVPTITPAEREALHHLFGSIDRTPQQEHAAVVPLLPTSGAGGLRPGDDFEARTDWADILTDWTLVTTQGNTRYWRRPGKTDPGFSATTGHADDRDRLYVFTTSTMFEAERPYNKFGAYACLHHGGDHSAAASALAKQGYGQNEQPAEMDLAGLAHTIDQRPTAQPVTLEEARAVSRKWLGEDYDTEAFDAVLAAAACDQLDGDPLWLLLLSGSGNAKTETVQALDGVGAHIISTISSAGALLSATSTKEKTKDATGGLLRKIGPTGILVIKDVTSIISMDRNSRAEVLAALREVYDGRWSRNVGTDGGRTLAWAGRLITIGAVTTVWDRAHDVIASMGDRFVIIRMDSTTGRQAAGRRAIGNTGHEERMRRELAEAAAGVLAGIDTSRVPAELTTEETEILIEAANIVTLVRTGVDFDYRGDVIDAHAPEMPTRFAKQLGQIVRGAIALGMDRRDSLALAIRCARDSMPPLRLAILDDVAANPGSPTKDVRKRLAKPRATIDRQLQALHILNVLDVDEEPIMHGDTERTIWRYTVSPSIDPRAIQPNCVPEMLVSPHKDTKEESKSDHEPVIPPSNISGTQSPPGCQRHPVTPLPKSCPQCSQTHARKAS
jgi:hypothetical protein